ncbi:MAG: Stp1/IreP family PP2C-type Ser/Thr phosphatase, partial [Deltaproteobacteria bacterium]
GKAVERHECIRGVPVRVAYQTRTGNGRESNEDSLFVDRDSGLFIVADGMGGHNAGEVASSLAVRKIEEYVRQGLHEGEDPRDLLERSIVTAHEAILESSARSPDLAEMGTTVVIALVQGDRLWAAHVGDSRAYMMGKGLIRQITHDHTFIADLLAEGRITVEQAKSHEARHGLHMALGAGDEVQPDIADWKWEENDCLLLCSDGLTDMLDDNEILAIVEDSIDLGKACADMVRKAKEKGGQDDVTVVLVCR